MPLAAVSDFTSPGFAVLAALLGAWVGAWVGGRNLVRLEEKRQKDRDIREQREEALLVKSIARVHSDNLRRASTVAGTVLVTNRWPNRGEHRLAPEIPDADRLLLARHLTNESWQTLSEAHFQKDVIVRAIEAEAGNPLPGKERELLEEGIKLFDRARFALAALETGAKSEEESTIL